MILLTTLIDPDWYSTSVVPHSVTQQSFGDQYASDEVKKILQGFYVQLIFCDILFDSMISPLIRHFKEYIVK